MTRALLLATLLAPALALGARGQARADDPAPQAGRPAPAPRPPPPPEPPTVVHVPADELDLLIRAQGKGVVLRYAEYQALLAAARAKEEGDQAAPPADAVRLSGEGTLDLSDEKAARLHLVYRVRGLAPGPRSLGWESGGAAFESVGVEPEGGAGAGRYEEREGGKGRLWLDGPGVRRVTVEGSAVPARDGARRLLDLWLPNPAAMSLAVTLPPGVEATIWGEGPPVVAVSPAEKPLVVTTRPTRGGNLKIAWAQSAKGTEGPSVLDGEVKILHLVGDGVVQTLALVKVDVLRTPTDTLVLGVPADLTVRRVEGAGVTGSSRSEDRKRLSVRLEKPVLGAVEVLLQGERRFQPGPGVELARVTLEGAMRHRGEVALAFGADVNAHGVTVDGGRRVAREGVHPDLAGVLRYALSRPDATVRVDVEPGRLRVDATSTYYLNLAEPGQTIIAVVTYRVAEGTLFAISPRFPREYDLRELTLNGSAEGFRRDDGADGRVQITLARAVPAGGEVLLQAVLERARADWVPEKEHAAVPFPVPSSGATREEGYVAVGADAGFEVHDTEAKDLLAVGAADLTARGLSATGLVYGYRLDGAQPSVTLDVVRREPLIDAEVITVAHPGPRRIDLAARVVYRIQRAGVRRLFLDLPTTAGEQVAISAPWFRSATHLKERFPDLPEGYDRWQVDLERRVIGPHVVQAHWFRDRDRDDWTLPGSEALAARAPLERSQRLLVVRRSEGLEVSLPTLAAATDVRPLDVGELPPEAFVDPRTVLQVLRLPPTRDGIDLAVRKHTGAAVLNAIATQVSLRTAVASEGLLRTRAEVELFNVDRQFVEVRLPPGSSLIGAVVDGKPVKPLVDPHGELLVTVAPTRPTVADRAPRTRVVLTYETRLDGRVGSRVKVEAPLFPGLEVLRTTQEVGFEEDVVVAAVSGDLLAQGRIERPTREPWLVRLAHVLARGAGGGASAPATAAQAREYDGERRSAPGAPPAGEASLREPGDPGAPPPPDLAPRPAVPATPTPPAAVPPPAPPVPGGSARVPGPQTPGGDEHAETGNDMPFNETLGETEGDGKGVGGGAGGKFGARPREAKPGHGPGEGGEPGQEWTSSGRRRGAARKGQLSLDVPVYLAPQRVIAQRIGGGGAVEIELVSRAGSERGYQALGLGVLALGLLLTGRRWLPGWLTALAGLTAALVLHLTLGAGASTTAVAVADASTLLALLLALRWLVRKLVGAPAAPSAPPAPPATGPGPLAPGAVTALLLTLLAVASAAPARADDEAAADEEGSGLAGGGAVLVPTDGSPGAQLRPDDRVFVPLKTWLDLQKKAHPERDPELAVLGQVVTLVGAQYRVEVGEKNVDGTAHLTFAQRGQGLLLVPLPLAGVAITEARLDGQPLRLLLDGALYRLPLDREGDHVLDLVFQAPVTTGPAGRSFTFAVPTSVTATLDVAAGDFDGELSVAGAGRVAVLSSPAAGEEFVARAYLGRAVGAGPVTSVAVVLAEKTPASMPAAVRTRAESRVVHSVRDGGTETVLTADLHVLQGKAPFVDLALPDGVSVLEASGPHVQRWETSPGRLRLVFAAPAEGRLPFRVRAFRSSDAAERSEALPELTVRDTTGESGLVIVNGDPTLRLDVTAGEGLFRTGRPGEPDAVGPDGQGRVAGAWRFAARPAPVAVRASRALPRTEVQSRVRVTFGDDRVRTVLEATVRIQRARVGDLVFALPGTDEVRSVEGPGSQTWWLEGTGDARRLFVRYADLMDGDHPLAVRLERRLGGVKDGLQVPRWTLEGAQGDRGTLLVFSLPDVEPVPGLTEGLRQLPPSRLDGQEPNVPGARGTHAYEWEASVPGALPLVLRTPEQEVEATVVTQVAPSDEEQRLEHLVVFDVRRGATDRLRVFVPDGGLAANDVVRARDLREVRSEPAVHTDPDGQEVHGLLYTVRLQSEKSGLIEVTVSQLWPSGRTLRVVRPQQVKAVRWFGLVRKFLDGEVNVQPGKVAPGTAGPEKADWADLPFVPTGVDLASFIRLYAARAPYTLELTTRRFALDQQSDAVVLAATAEVVVGLDGEARVRARYRLFNRSRQFLRLRLPEGAVLYGAVAARRPVKPLAGADGTLLLPVPKVPLGGTGYEVAVTYRARVGAGFHGGGKATLLLPEVPGVEVDRTAITLYVPDGFDWSFETKMTPAQERDVIGERVDAALKETREVLKVAENGTFDQRLAACSNSAPLLEEARRRLVDLEGRGASAAEVADKKQEVERLAGLQREVQAQCQIDQSVVRNDVEIAQAAELAGANANGQVLVVVDPDAAKAGEPATATQAPMPQGGANWRFNADAVPLDRAEKKDLLELKNRLQTELAKRGADETRKSVNVQQEAQSRASRAKEQEKAPPAMKQAAPDDATLRFDENRNNAYANDTLRRVQTQSRQLGGEAYAAFQTEGAASGYVLPPGGGGGPGDAGRSPFQTYRGQQIHLTPSDFTPAGPPDLVDLDDVTNGLEDGSSAGFDNGGGGLGTGAALPPSAGVLFGVGQDGDFRARTENIYGQPLGAVDTRVGLMGVDVPLPRVGRVYWFTSARAGAALSMEASPSGTSPWLRGLLALALLGALGYGLVLVARRR